jgi:hypothetical protein
MKWSIRSLLGNQATGHPGFQDGMSEITLRCKEERIEYCHGKPTFLTGNHSTNRTSDPF